MITPINLREDLHVHSTFSDGRGSLAENITRGEAMGLERLGCVDHVRQDTTWLPNFVAAVHAQRRETSMSLVIGVEATILDEDGTVNLPPGLGGVDRIYIADHRLPLGERCLNLAQARHALRSGEVDGERIVRALVGSTCRALERTPGAVIAHLFSMLPKLGLNESIVSRRQLIGLATVAQQTGAWLELDERWRCPGPRVVQVFLDAGVRVVASSDAHQPSHIGSYSWLSRTAAALETEARFKAAL